jgi:3-carboxy-cis,cis-muconate cycloisomerase
MSQLYASLFYQNEVTEIFSDRALVSYMIEAEVALAQAQAQVGVIPESAATAISNIAATAIDQIDFDALAVATGLAGNIAIPFVKQLTAIVKQSDEDAARYVHWGATSQDILDTACILQCRAAMTHVEALIHQCYRCIDPS